MGKKKKKNLNRGVLAQWGVTAAVLFVVVMIMVIKFSVSNEGNARNIAFNMLVSDTSTYAQKMGTRLNQVMKAGEGIATSLEIEKETDHDKLQGIATSINSRLDDVYLVVIAGKNGKGVASNNADVDISAREYFYSGSTAKFLYTQNECILQRPAYIMIVPYITNGEIAGNIYLFADPDEIQADFPRDEYGGGIAFALIGSDGSIITRTGNNSYFTSEGNLFTNLSTSTLEELSLSQIKLRAEKLNKMAFAASKGDEKRTITVAPIGVSDWQLVIAVNQKYVDTVLRNTMSDARKLVTGLAITICLFVVIIIVMAMISKFKYGEENKDLADKADTDLLTALNNKIATERKIQEFMDENPNSQCLMFLFDIDNFKKINDTMGHAFGDEVLRTLGHSLRNEFRVTDIIGRLGGDEFVLFLKNIKSDEQLERESIRITNFFHQFKAGDYVKYSATASIGAVVFPRDVSDFQSAYEAADKALYEAKKRGKNQLVFYDKNMKNVESVRVSDDIDPAK